VLVTWYDNLSDEIPCRAEEAATDLTKRGQPTNTLTAVCSYVCLKVYTVLCGHRYSIHHITYCTWAIPVEPLHQLAMNDDLDEATSSSEQEHAPWLPIPSRAISVVEHPSN
jgi:hypothetical protein